MRLGGLRSFPVDVRLLIITSATLLCRFLVVFPHHLGTGEY